LAIHNKSSDDKEVNYDIKHDFFAFSHDQEGVRPFAGMLVSFQLSRLAVGRWSWHWMHPATPTALPAGLH
jgi:hypothetical protein